MALLAVSYLWAREYLMCERMRSGVFAKEDGVKFYEFKKPVR